MEIVEDGSWKRKDEAPEDDRDGISWDENGQRFARIVEGVWRGLTGFSPDDYFFDGKNRAHCLIFYIIFNQ